MMQTSKYKNKKVVVEEQSEHEIQNAVIAYLTLKNFYIIRLNAGSYKTKTGYVQGVKAGTPDVMAFKKDTARGYYGSVRLYFLEIKKPGKKATKIQEERMKELEAKGAKCLVIHSVSELEEAGL